VLIFALGAGLALYEGVQHVLEPAPPSGSHTVNYIVLGLSFLFESGSWWVAYRNFRAAEGEANLWEAIEASKDPPAFIVLLEDSAALIGLVIAAADFLDMPVLDGVASIGIGLLLATTAFFLASESKSLLIGEAAAPEMTRSIRRILSNEPAMGRLKRLWTLHLAPEQIIAVMELDFADLKTMDIDDAITRIQKRIKTEVPAVVSIFIRPTSSDAASPGVAERPIGGGPLLY
jgi:divalent metal cation (Fe/Co/Zn/Cd) transporter